MYTEHCHNQRLLESFYCCNILNSAIWSNSPRDSCHKILRFILRSFVFQSYLIRSNNWTKAAIIPDRLLEFSYLIGISFFTSMRHGKKFTPGFEHLKSINLLYRRIPLILDLPYSNPPPGFVITDSDFTTRIHQRCI